MQEQDKNIFDPEQPVEAPEAGYELKPKGQLSTYHHQTRDVSRQIREMQLLTDDASMLYGNTRGLKKMLSAMLLKMNLGDVRTAMRQMLHSNHREQHRPFIDPSRPEGKTHIVTDEDTEITQAPLRTDRKRFEWKTNLY